VSFVGWLQGDGAAGEQHEGQRGSGAVEAVGAPCDEPDLVVECFGAGVGQAQAHGGEDPVAVFADGLGEADEGCHAAA
jgi:hypothetical protein